MPIYEYRCSDCNNQFELMQKFSDPPAQTCPSCAGTVHKLISRSAFHLKGGGWYVTDYGKNGNASAKGANKGGTESSTEGGEAKSTSDSGSSSSSSSSDSPASSSGSTSSSHATTPSAA